MDFSSGLDLIRIGVYAQLEGSFVISGNRNNYRFRFQGNQIRDMATLLSRVSEKPFDQNGLTYSISSKDLFEKIQSLGFYSFYKYNWNIPKLHSFGETGRKEYLRAVIDSIGNVDVERTSPVVQISSVNIPSAVKLAEIFDGKTNGPYDEQRVYVRWRGDDATRLLDYLDWRFYNYRNERGASLIQSVRWSDYI